MLPEQPFKYICPKCGYSKTVTPTSDARDPRDFMNRCPKCGGEMEKRGLDFLDSVKRIFTR